MEDRYVARRVDQALEKCGGDRARAHRLLVKLCATDRQLAQRLTAPYLPGIVARAMEGPAGRPSGPGKAGRAAGPGKAGRGAGKARRPEPELPDKALDAVVGQLAEHIGETKAPRGMTALVTPAVKTRCSPSHLKAVHTLIGAYSNR